MILALMMSLAAPPQAGLVKTTVLAVRVRVVETCEVTPAAVRCSGAQPTQPPRIRVTADGVRTVEF